MDDCGGLRQRGRKLVMVGDDQFQAEFRGNGGFGDGRDAAINGDDDFRPRGGELTQSFVVEAVAFFEPARDVEIRLAAEQAQALQQERGGRHAVDVVVAVDGDLPAVAHGAHQSSGGFRDAAEQRGIAQ